MMRLGVAVVTRGTEYEYCLSGLHRLMLSLYASDIPKDTLITISWVPETPEQVTKNLKEGRRRAVLHSMINTDAVLLTETDIIVPEIWWSQVEKAFEDPSVGIVCTDSEVTEKMPGWEWSDYLFDDAWFRGQEFFMVFRKEFLEDGLKDDPTLTHPSMRFRGFPFSPQRSVLHTRNREGDPVALDNRRWTSCFLKQIKVTHSRRTLCLKSELYSETKQK